jgi:membrane-bound lytic murein transglycosylase D
MQRAVAGGPSAADLAAGPESEELRALREAELDLFAGAAPGTRSSWPAELPTPPKGPLAVASNAGLPPPPPAPAAEVPASGGKSLAWLSALKMPDLPVRWDARVVKYLEFFKDDPRGRRLFAVWYKRSGRYLPLIQAQLRAKGLPEDLAWIAMAESGFDPLIKSPAGAAGLWQFMPDTGKSYGLSGDRWADARLSPIRATEAAVAFLGDLKRRFGSWELAIASYNMGYGGVLSVVKRFNTNDYWELSKLENALPWETTLYVPKIIAIAVVAKNPETFGYADVVFEPSLKGENVAVPAGTELRAIATAAGCTTQEIEKLNPELRSGRTPPASGSASGDDASYVVVVPAGKAIAVKDASAKLALSGGKGSSLERYVVRFGETLDQVAIARKTTKAKLVELNGIRSDEAVRGGTVLLVPALPAGTAPTPTSPFVATSSSDPRPIVVVSPTAFAYADRKRVFYKVLVGDTPREIADAFGVSIDQLRSWNSIEPSARLQEGMTLQIFVAKGFELSRVVALEEKQAKVVAVGSDEFYALEEEKKGRRRTTILAKGGETLETVGKRYGLSAGSMEKINRRPRGDVLKAGETVIVYVPASGPPVPVPAGTGNAPAKPNELELPALPPAEKTADAKDVVAKP